MELTAEERKELSYCISMRINVIQTGNPTLSQQDCISMKKPEEIKALSLEQMQYILYLDKLRQKIIDN